MKRVFLDSSVLFSAAYSSKGHSRDVLMMAAREQIAVVISQLVLDETRQNLAESAPQHTANLDLLIAAIPFEYVRPTKREILAAVKLVAVKDAPILAAARKAKVDLLVTLDKASAGQARVPRNLRSDDCDLCRMYELLPQIYRENN